MSLKELFLRAINRLLMRYGSVNHICADEGTLYLTFDDGPEPVITDFVLDELDKYGFKATFFCRGDNAERYPDLVAKIVSRGHAIGNHTFEHIKAYDRDAASYVADVERANDVLHTHLFRPPNGCLRLTAWLKLRRKYRIIYWTLGSGDWCKEPCDWEGYKDALRQSRSGDIVLFHFSGDLEKGTRTLLPWYLNWLKEHRFTSDILR